MKVLHAFKALPWKKAAAFLAAAILLFAVWGWADSLIYRPASAGQEMAREAELWQIVKDLREDEAGFFGPALELRGQLSKLNQAVSSGGKETEEEDEETFSAGRRRSSPPSMYDAAAFRNLAARHDQVLLRSRARLDKTVSAADTGYGEDVLMLYACCFKSYNVFLAMMEREIYGFAKRTAGNVNDRSAADYDERLALFDRLYLSDNEDKAFAYPGYKKLSEMFCAETKDLLICRCFQGHGGFALWSGRSLKAVESDFQSAEQSLINFSFYKRSLVLTASQVRCTELRSRKGSLYSSLRKKLYAGQDQLNRWLCVQSVKLPLPLSLIPEILVGSDRRPPLGIAVNTCRTAEDKVWDTARYAALSTQNFLWTVKFRDKNNKDSAFMKKCRIRKLYAKDSPEMRQYRQYFAKDLAGCRQMLEAPEYRGAQVMHKAALDLCASAEAVLEIWDGYCAGRLDYTVYAAALKKRETDFEQKLYAAQQARRDYLYRRFLKADVFADMVITYEGVTDERAEQPAGSGA